MSHLRNNLKYFQSYYLTGYFISSKILLQNVFTLNLILYSKVFLVLPNLVFLILSWLLYSPFNKILCTLTYILGSTIYSLHWPLSWFYYSIINNLYLVCLPHLVFIIFYISFISLTSLLISLFAYCILFLLLTSIPFISNSSDNFGWLCILFFDSIGGYFFNRGFYYIFSISILTNSKD